ncbi:MAG: Ni/Fe-hydrogenase cytochrome b subunit [Planctomycetes bacterium]|nr:Ni/Fe-hydrogenase cytochrome b subunit [Planctomycetota bacterium]
MTLHAQPVPLGHKVLTPGVFLLLVLIAVGLGFAAYRFVFGLSATTNLDQQHPWGLWIAIDVATGVALAAGGFTTAALVHVFHREHFHVVARPALLTAMLGYTFVGLGLMADLGRYYNIWHPMLPSMWQGNSVLFEVGMCVMCYLTVLYLEFLPVVCERLERHARRPALARLAVRARGMVEAIMPLLLIAGVVLSCLHQSSLGNLMVIAPTKVHALWYTPILSLLFLLSAIAVGFPMVIVESLAASWAMETEPEMPVLSRLAKYVPVLLGVYAAFKVGDLAVRERQGLVLEGSLQSTMFLIEMLAGVLLPLLLFLSARVRNRPGTLFLAALLVVLGVALNRVNVFWIAYRPPYAVADYVPALGEIAVTLGLISLLILCYRLAVTYLPVIAAPHRGRVA